MSPSSLKSPSVIVSSIKLEIVVSAPNLAVPACGCVINCQAYAPVQAVPPDAVAPESVACTNSPGLNECAGSNARVWLAPVRL